MARKYAGIMASLAMALVLARAIRDGGGFESTIASAMLWMIALGVVGGMVGAIARATVDEAVRQRMEYEINATKAVSDQRSAFS